MEKLLVKGEKIVISRINDPSQQMNFELKYPKHPSIIYDLDLFVFLMDEGGRAVKDGIIYYGNPAHEGGGIVYSELYEENLVKKNIEINLSKIPMSIYTICLGTTIYCKNKNNIKGQQIRVELNAINKTLRSQMFKSVDTIDLVRDETFILGDIYKYRDTWKYNAVKQEMDEGLMKVMKKLYHLEVY